jgi:hypothetical protein
MKRMQHLCSSLLRPAVQSDHERHESTNQKYQRRLVKGNRRATMIGVVFLCLISIAPAMAQKKPVALEANTELSPASKDYYAEVAKAYKADISAGNANQALVDRNRLIYLAVDQMDLNFYDFQKNTRKKRALFQTILDILEIGASTAISITNGDRAKTLIAEGLGAVQLSRMSINKNFALKDTQILFNKMVSKRAQILGTILTRSVQPVSQYPFESALIDLIAYYRAGTFDGALENLNIDTGAEASEATAVVEQLKIKTAAQLEKADDCDKSRAALFLKSRDSNPQISGPAIAKLKTNLKNNISLTNKTAVEIDALDVAGLAALYTKIARDLLNTPEKLQPLCDGQK